MTERVGPAQLGIVQHDQIVCFGFRSVAVERPVDHPVLVTFGIVTPHQVGTTGAAGQEETGMPRSDHAKHALQFIEYHD